MSQESCLREYKSGLFRDKHFQGNPNMVHYSNFSLALKSENQIRDRMQDVWQVWGVSAIQRDLWTLTYFHADEDVVPSSPHKDKQ